jgi:hypothetical protein
MGSGSGSNSTPPAEFEFVPTSGQTIQIPDTDALLINVMLWPVAPIDHFQLILPNGLVAGRRVFIFAGQAVTEVTVTSPDVGVQVMNNVISMNVNDLVVFNTVSTTRKIIARVATS